MPLTSEADPRFRHELSITEDELAEARRIGDHYSLEQVYALLAQFYAAHRNDPNIDYFVLERVKTFIGKSKADSCTTTALTTIKIMPKRMILNKTKLCWQKCASRLRSLPTTLLTLL